MSQFSIYKHINQLRNIAKLFYNINKCKLKLCWYHIKPSYLLKNRTIKFCVKGGGQFMETYQEKIKQKLTVVPIEPGCYLMKDRNDQIIYVGKAKKLRNRLRSYFTGAHDAKTTRLVGEIRNFEFIVTSSETESLLLELNLSLIHIWRCRRRLRCRSRWSPYH